MDKTKIIAEVVTKRSFTIADIDDILCTAFEGGIAYWASNAEVDSLLEQQIDYFHEIVSRDGVVKIYIYDGDELADQNGVETDGKGNYFVLLTLEKLKRGLQLAEDQERLPDDLEDFDADVIVQLACFGEIVFC